MISVESGENQQFSLCRVGLRPVSTSLSRCSDYCADCCGTSGSAVNRKRPTRTDQRFSPSLLKTRIAEPEQAGRSVLLLAENSFETVIDVSKMEFHRTELLQFAGFEVLADIGVRQKLSFEIRAGFSCVLGLPGFHCVALA